MSYYNYNALFPAGQAQDRVRGARLPQQGPELSTVEEAFTRENWIIRIYKVKDLDNVGRDHASAVAFDRGHKKKQSAGAKIKTQRVLRREQRLDFLSLGKKGKRGNGSVVYIALCQLVRPGWKWKG